MTIDPSQTIELRTGSLNDVAEARVGVMIVDVPRIRLGVIEPDGTEHVEWYTEGQTLSASGCEWRISRIRPRRTHCAGDIVATLAPMAKGWPTREPGHASGVRSSLERPGDAHD